MTRADKKKSGWLVWLFVPIVLAACAALGNFVGDMVLIWAVYGREAYFEQGLRIVKHKPFTLSTGVVLSVNLGALGWFISVVLWLLFTFLSMRILVRLVEAFKRKDLAPGE